MTMGQCSVTQMTKTFLILIGCVLSAFYLPSQTLQDDSLSAIKFRKWTDSSRAAFNNQPKYLFIHPVCVNGQVLKNYDKEKFALFIDGKQIQLPKDSLGYYFINFPIDTNQKATLRL